MLLTTFGRWWGIDTGCGTPDNVSSICSSKPLEISVFPRRVSLRGLLSLGWNNSGFGCQLLWSLLTSSAAALAFSDVGDGGRMNGNGSWSGGASVSGVLNGQSAEEQWQQCEDGWLQWQQRNRWSSLSSRAGTASRGPNFASLLWSSIVWKKLESSDRHRTGRTKDNARHHQRRQ